jgi:hypothetical protein
MNIRTTLIISSIIAASLVTGAAHAALQGRDLNGSAGSFEAYYDTDLNITWLADANYAKTSGYHGNGQMTWHEATTWVASLSFIAGVNVYDDWRLPSALNQNGTGPCNRFNCTDSEMGHMFYVELGGTSHHSILESTDPDLAKFSNIQGLYWSSTEASDESLVWLFGPVDGYQTSNYKADYWWAWAVSDGDVGVSAVPEPETYAMLLAGLLFIGFAKRHHSNNHKS